MPKSETIMRTEGGREEEWRERQRKKKKEEKEKECNKETSLS